MDDEWTGRLTMMNSEDHGIVRGALMSLDGGQARVQADGQAQESSGGIIAGFGGSLDVSRSDAFASETSRRTLRVRCRY